MSVMTSMEDILNTFKNTKEKKFDKKLNFIKEIQEISDNLLEIIKNNSEKYNNTIIDFDKVFENDIRDLKEKDIVFLIQNIDDITSFMLLITSLLSNYTTKHNFELSYNEIFNYFSVLDEKFREKVKDPKYNKKRVLKDLYKYKKYLINTTNRQYKYIFNCFCLFILIPYVNTYKFFNIFNRKSFKLNKYNDINRDLIGKLTTYLSSNPKIYKKYKKLKAIQNLSKIGMIFGFIKNIITGIIKILIDILTFIYFLIYGIKIVDKEISFYEKKLVKDYNKLRDTTKEIINNLNEGDVLKDLLNYKNKNYGIFENEVKNESNFSISSNKYIEYANKILKSIVKNYIYLRKYLYNEKDFLNNIKRK